MLIDTDVLIWYIKGNARAYQAIEQYNSFFISVVTYMELVQGMRNKQELNTLRKAMYSWDAKILYISEEISAKAMFYIEQHFLGHSIQLADAHIAATAAAHGLPILTTNNKHFAAMKNIEVRKFSP